MTPLLVALSACAFLVEQREAPTEITWGGWVLADLPSTGEVVTLESGTVELTDLDGDLIAEASQPYDSDPGWWEVRVPVHTEVAIRVAGSTEAGSALPALVPTVWRGRTPEGRAYWLEGVLFTRELDYLDGFLESLAELPDVDPVPLADGSVAHLWGEPLDPEAWAGADITVMDGDGDVAQVLAFEADDSGALVQTATGPVDFFIALNLPEGTTTLTVDAVDRDPVSTSWPTRGGDLLSAIYYALPEQQ